MARNFGRPIVRIILHTTQTSLGAKPDAIRRFWFTPRANAKTGATKPYIPDVQGGAGFKRAEGYHYMIDAEGRRHIRHHLSEVTNGVRGYNWNSVHISTIGGAKGDDRTPAQIAELIKLINELRSDEILGMIPVRGHSDFAAKDCPWYSASEWCRSVGIDPL